MSATGVERLGADQKSQKVTAEQGLKSITRWSGGFAKVSQMGH